MENNVSIYRLTHRDSGRVYIGQTNNIKKREQAYRTLHCKGQTYLLHALQKYGFGAFNLDVLETGLTREQANKREIELISHYRSTEREFGFNCALGGSNGNHSPEIIEKIRKKAVEQFSSPEAKKALSERAKEHYTEGRICVALMQKNKESREFSKVYKNNCIPEYALDHNGIMRKVVDKGFPRKTSSPWQIACLQKYRWLRQQSLAWLKGVA